MKNYLADLLLAPPNNTQITPLTPQFFPQYGSKRVKLSYGPFVIPPGQTQTFIDVQPPCNNCMITWMQVRSSHCSGNTPRFSMLM